jgi:hypothetical protein
VFFDTGAGLTALYWTMLWANVEIVLLAIGGAVWAVRRCASLV